MGFYQELWERFSNKKELGLLGKMYNLRKIFFYYDVRLFDRVKYDNYNYIISNLCVTTESLHSKQYSRGIFLEEK